MPALLAFDTATDRLHLGLSLGTREWPVESEGGASASGALIGRILALLTGAGAALRELDAIAFGRGPGAFTGLRTACAVAQGLALGSGRPLLAIDTLMAVAEDARLRTGASDVWAATDARMGEIYAARYAHDGQAWRTVSEPGLYAPQELALRWQEQPVQAVAGNALLAFEGRIGTGSALVVADARPTARALLACARAAWAQGAHCDAADALPLYVRNRVASTTAEREALKAAPAAAR
jgi:tRNA threonylcarbamoyladenosine biosynthesis protein TsaB